MRRHLPMTIIAVSVIALSACSGGSADTLPDHLASVSPTAQAATTYTPLATPPMEYRTVSGPHYSISVPGGWDERIDEQSTATVKPVAYTDPTAEAGTIMFVGIIVDTPGAADVLGQSLVLVADKRTSGAQEITREALTWPGAERAVRLTWQETLGGGTSPTQYEQLMVQVRDGLIVNAVAAAPAQDYAATELETILRTLVVKP